MADHRLGRRLSGLFAQCVVLGLLCLCAPACSGTEQGGDEASLAPNDPQRPPGKQNAPKRISPAGQLAALQVAEGAETRYVAPALVGRSANLSATTLGGLRRAARMSASPMRLRVDEARGAVAVLHGDFPPLAGAGAGARAEKSVMQDMLPTLGLRGPGARAVGLVERSRLSEDDGAAHVAFGLTYRGLPIFLAEAIVHLDGRGHARSFQTAGVGQVDMLNDALRVDGAAALQIARAAVGPAPVEISLAQLPEPELGVWPGNRGDHEGGVFAYRVYLHGSEPEGSYQTYAAYVAATDGQLLALHAQRASETPRAATGSAKIYDGSTVPLAISRYASSGLYALVDQSRGLSSGVAVTFQGRHNQDSKDDTLTTSSSTTAWEPESALIHRNVQLSLDYYKKTHGRSGWDGQGADMPVVAHYGSDYNNAHWSGWDRVMSIGDGDGQRYYPLGRALDVIAHELTHAVIDSSGGLVYQNQSGALNESFADVMAIMVDRDDYLLGEDVAGPTYGRNALRSVQDPAAFGFPAHMNDYDNSGYDYGGVHINSSIPNHVAYLLAEARSREVVEQIWYRTLQQRHITSTATFRDMALGTLASCEELKSKGKTSAADCESLIQSWAGVGVLSLSELPGSGCPLHSKARMGLCLCDQAYTPSADGSMCVAFADVTCPAHAVATQGECYCLDGYAPNGDFSACLEEKNACPDNATWDASVMRCVCKEGFEGDPQAAEGTCNVISSDCGEFMHPEWRSDPEQNPDDYACLCNDGYELALDGLSCVVPLGGCGNESFFGRCSAAVLTYCGPDGIEVVDCAQTGLVCGLLDSLVGYDCLNPKGRGPAASCDPNIYQQCDADNPFCVENDTGNGAFCSQECNEDRDCGAAYGCCAAVSDGSRACLTDAFCQEVVDRNAKCNDVPSGSTYKGACEGNLLRFCDGSSATTREVNCTLSDQVCTKVSDAAGFDCVPRNQASLDFTPAVFCPFDQDGVCDVPDRCPEGSDLLDCNPCGDVDAFGVCEGDMLQRCDESAGLLVIDCSAMDGLTCAQVDGSAACAEPVPDGGTADAGPVDGGDDAGEDDAAMADVDAGSAGRRRTVGCSCRVAGGDSGRRNHGLWLVALAFAWLSSRSRARRR